VIYRAYEVGVVLEIKRFVSGPMESA
jgi:hypothetical protein